MKTNSLKRKATVSCLDLWEVWSCSYCLPPVGAAKGNETEIFEITTLRVFVTRQPCFSCFKTDPAPPQLACVIHRHSATVYMLRFSSLFGCEHFGLCLLITLPGNDPLSFQFYWYFSSRFLFSKFSFTFIVDIFLTNKWTQLTQWNRQTELNHCSETNILFHWLNKHR